MHYKYYYAFILFCCLYVSTLCRKRKTYEILKIENCNENSLNLLTKLVKTKMRTRRNGNNSLELTFSIEKEITNDVEGVTTISKCDILGTLESCEYIVKNLKFKKFCEKLFMRNQLWSSFVEGVRPPLECPLKPGTYNVEVFLNEGFKYFFPLPIGVWKAHISFSLQNKVISCGNMDLKVYEKVFR